MRLCHSVYQIVITNNKYICSEMRMYRYVTHAKQLSLLTLMQLLGRRNNKKVDPQSLDDPLAFIMTNTGGSSCGEHEWDGMR